MPVFGQFSSIVGGFALFLGSFGLDLLNRYVFFLSNIVYCPILEGSLSKLLKNLAFFGGQSGRRSRFRVFSSSCGKDEAAGMLSHRRSNLSSDGRNGSSLGGVRFQGIDSFSDLDILPILTNNPRILAFVRVLSGSFRQNPGA
jgi:hypothetical protein